MAVGRRDPWPGLWLGVLALVAGLAQSSRVQAEDFSPAGPALGMPGATSPGGVPEILPAPPQRMVVDVRIDGNRTIKNHKIAQFIRARAGRPLDPRVIEEDVRSLNKSRMFVNVETLTQEDGAGGVVIIYRVTERPVLEYVKYVGARQQLFRKDIAKLLGEQTGLKVGDALDPFSIEEGRRRIEEWYKERGYSKVQVSIFEGDKPGDHGAVYLIHLGPKQRVGWVSFEGNTIANDARLRTQIQSKPGLMWVFKGFVNRNKIDEDQERLTAYYRSLGFFRAEIGRELEFDDSGNWLHLRFVINEGPRYVVRNVTVEGNRKFGTDELTQNLRLKPGEFFDQDSMTRDVLAVQDVYGTQGYVFAAVTPDPRFLEEPGTLDLVYNIKEGDRWRVGDINIHILGDESHTRREVVLNRISLRPGDIIDMRELRASERRLRACGVFEYRDPNKAPRLIVAPENIEDIEELAGDPPPGGTVRGQSPDDYRPGEGRALPSTNPNRSRRPPPSGYLPGPAPSGTGNASSDPAAESSQRAMFQPPPVENPWGGTGVNPQGVPDGALPYPGSEEEALTLPPIDEPTRPLTLEGTVYETQTGRIMLGAGYNSEAGLVGQFIVDEQNFDITRFPRSWEDIRTARAFRGGGQQFRFEAAPGNQFQRYSILFREPYLFDTMVSFAVRAHLYDRRFRDWDEQRTGGGVSFGYQLTPDLSVNLNLDADKINVRNPTIPSPPELLETLGNNQAYAVGVDLVYDIRDNAFLPTEGHRVALGFSQTMGSFDYPRFSAEASKYFLITERPDRSGRHVLGLSSRVGFSGTHTPLYDHYFAGGFSTIRGFEFRGASPVAPGGVVLGGEFQFLNSVQYMFPLSANDMLRGVVFCDFGTVEARPRLAANTFRVAPGFGLRISIPGMGPAPFAVDLAFPIAHADGDDIDNFSVFVNVAR
jgi:outer membrane protein insertion porin family